MKAKMLTLALCALVLVGCSTIESAQQFMKEMTAVQQAVVKLTGHEETRIMHFNGHVLQVILVNSKYNEMEGEEKEEVTKEIAQTAYDALATKSRIDEVTVIFHIHGNKLGIEYNNSLDSHNFPVADLERAPEGGPSPSPVASSPTAGPSGK
jgi:hypothetical protein